MGKVSPRGPRWIAGADDAGTRLDKFLAVPERLGSRGRAVAALERGKVYINGREAPLAAAGRPLAPADEVTIWMDRPGSASARFRAGRFGGLAIVHEDDRLIVVNKPPGLLSVPLERNPGVPSVFEQVEARFRSRGKRRPLVVHRIDQDTSGVVLFAKDAAAQAHLRAQFTRREPERVYWAVVCGQPDPPSGTWRDHVIWDEKALIQKQTHAREPRAAEAESEYRTIEAFAEASLLEVRLRTGRRNQVRIQAGLRGHPLVGERRYVYAPAARQPIPFGRHALHACRLTCRHPDDDRQVSFEAPAPGDLRDLIARLRPVRDARRRPR